MALPGSCGALFALAMLLGMARQARLVVHNVLPHSSQSASCFRRPALSVCLWFEALCVLQQPALGWHGQADLIVAASSISSGPSPVQEVAAQLCDLVAGDRPQDLQIVV